MLWRCRRKGAARTQTAVWHGAERLGVAVLEVLVVSGLAGLAGCSSGGKKSAGPTTTKAPVTTTSTVAAGQSAVTSNDPVARALNNSLLTEAETQAALGLAGALTPEIPGPTATPQGPLNEQGILSVVPNAAVYKPIYEGAGGGVGANATYHASSPKLDVDLLAVKFATQQGGQSFVQQELNLATTLAQGKATPHPEMHLGVLPSEQQIVVRVPPGPLTGTQETVLTDILYANGSYYLLAVMGPPGAVTDAQIIALAKKQDAKYLATIARSPN
jgi:hypothetical protein